MIDPDLRHGAVAIWTIDLDRADGSGTGLSPAEGERAARYRDTLVRRHFIAGRQAMRAVLAGYEGIEAAALRVGEEAHGKPALIGSDLCFTLSRSGGTALLAVTRGRALGIDGEQNEGGLDAMRDAAEVVMTDEERAIVDACPAPRRLALLRRLWARKEALAKATGLGMSLRLDDITVLAGEARSLVVELAGKGRFRVADLGGWPGMTVALCGAGPDELAPVDYRILPARV